MAFWGVEVKPGRPFIHPPNSGKGRLHVSQVTLGIGTGSGKCILQCNIGNKSPVLLCSLFSEVYESCQLNLEFDEVVQAVFSVLGPRSMHITGYYLPSGLRPSGFDDESYHFRHKLTRGLAYEFLLLKESFGEDIANTGSERSNSDDYDYSDEFINDSDISVVPNTSSEDDEPRKVNLKRRRLRKKYQPSSDKDDDPAPKTTADANLDTSSLDSEAAVSDFFISWKKQNGPKVEEKNVQSSPAKESSSPLPKQKRKEEKKKKLLEEANPGNVGATMEAQEDDCTKGSESKLPEKKKGKKKKKKKKMDQ